MAPQDNSQGGAAEVVSSEKRLNPESQITGRSGSKLRYFPRDALRQIRKAIRRGLVPIVGSPGAGDDAQLFFERQLFHSSGKGMDFNTLDLSRRDFEFGAAEVENLASSFDANFYLESYPDVAASGINPFWHFIFKGRGEGRFPSAGCAVVKNDKTQPLESLNIIDQIRPHFDENFYRIENGDLDEDLTDCVRHYVEFGVAEGRNPTSEFDTNFYLAEYPDVMASGVNPFWHFIFKGHEEGRYPTSDLAAVGANKTRTEKTLNVVEQIRPYFDEEFYRAQGEDLGDEFDDLVRHYVELGVAEGRNPTSEFDTSFYLETYKDIALGDTNPFLHYLLHGRQEGRQPNRTAHYRGWPFMVSCENEEIISEMVAGDLASKAALERVKTFCQSDRMNELVAKAAALEPDVGVIDKHVDSYCAPWLDQDFFFLRQCIDKIPNKIYTSVILMPAGRMGGADLVAAILAKALATEEKVIILRTDDSHWDRPEWYPETVTSVDISDQMNSVTDSSKLLYSLLCHIGARDIFNVNSRRAFETYLRFGSRLTYQFRLYAYYFCADRTEDGLEVGYPVWYFANIFPNLTCALTDTKNLSLELVERFSIPPAQRARVRSLYTPAVLDVPSEPIAARQLRKEGDRRPCVLWAGRLDRQKRFDLVVEVAAAMPDIDFRCWGKAVLDTPPNLDTMTRNLEINGPFDTYQELPLEDCDGFFYTAAWDGLPTILIEFGALGMPVAASAVGGVPELIDETTGWLFADQAGADAAVSALRQMLSDPDERVRRATALQQRVRNRHSMALYREEILAVKQGRSS